MNAPARAEHRYLVEEENRALVEQIGRPRRVLDVGCGIGLNGARAKARGAEVTGIEVAPTAVAEARRRLDEVLTIDLDDGPGLERALAGRHFDLMLFGDVLEHLADPARLLERLLPHLEEGGHAIVSLPNVAAWTMRLGLLRGRWDYAPSGILDETHLRFFTLKSARELLEAAGLEVLRSALNPMGVRALKGLVMRSLVAPGEPPLRQSLPYQLYQGLVRPLEDRAALLSPELFAFQHVLVARRPPRPRRLSLTVGMLTMNEEQSIERMIDEIRRHAPDAEILCVDSSTDQTPELARALGARVLRQIPPRGHGPAMEQLMYAAETELLIYLDCDFTYPPAYIPRLRALVEVEGFDVVNGARTRAKPAAMPWPNFVANRAFAALAHVSSGVPTVDVHSGMRAYRTSVIRAFDFDGEGDALPVETLLHPAKAGYRVCELPIEYDEREGVSKLRKLAGTLWTFARLEKARRFAGRGAAHFDVREG